MPAYKIRDRLIPYRILVYLYESEAEWLEKLAPGKIRIKTGPASRAFYCTSAQFWDALRWLRDQKLIKIQREAVRGVTIIKLRQPNNLK